MILEEKIKLSTALYLFKVKLIINGKWQSDTMLQAGVNLLKDIKSDIKHEILLGTINN